MNKIIFFIINYRIKKLNKKSINTNLKGLNPGREKQQKKRLLRA